MHAVYIGTISTPTLHRALHLLLQHPTSWWPYNHTPFVHYMDPSNPRGFAVAFRFQQPRGRDMDEPAVSAMSARQGAPAQVRGGRCPGEADNRQEVGAGGSSVFACCDGHGRGELSRLGVLLVVAQSRASDISTGVQLLPAPTPVK